MVAIQYIISDAEEPRNKLFCRSPIHPTIDPIANHNMKLVSRLFPPREYKKRVTLSDIIFNVVVDILLLLAMSPSSSKLL